MKSSEFVFDYVDGLHYNCNLMSLNRGGSYMDSREWVKNQKDTINPKNKNDNMYFKYTVTVALNHEKIKKTAKNVKD